jgi:hypothetical protein
LAPPSSWEGFRELGYDPFPLYGDDLFAVSLAPGLERSEAILLGAKVFLNEMAEGSGSHPRDSQETVLTLDQPHGKSVDAKNILAL